MLVKVILLFLLVMGVLALLGRLRFPGQRRRSDAAPGKPLICGKCGKYIIGDGRCDCGAPAARKR